MHMLWRILSEWAKDAFAPFWARRSTVQERLPTYRNPTKQEKEEAVREFYNNLKLTGAQRVWTFLRHPKLLFERSVAKQLLDAMPIRQQLTNAVRTQGTSPDGEALVIEEYLPLERLDLAACVAVLPRAILNWEDRLAVLRQTGTWLAPPGPADRVCLATKYWFGFESKFYLQRIGRDRFQTYEYHYVAIRDKD